MSLIINHNLTALTTQRNLNASSKGMTGAIEKLSSGYKINVGADDPSGLIISEQLRSQISGLERAVRNSSEAYNLIGIAEGALNEMNEILKKMRALAIHACNNGVTSPEQVAADQQEMDSGIQTLERIANTTRYSDQYLLNGSKELVYDVTTTVDEPTDHALINTKLTRVDQIFKRDGVKMSVGFTGAKDNWQANTKTQAQRAYLEADNANSLCQINGNEITAKQEFILTGTKGSRLFSFAEGTNMGTIVEGINNVKDSTGVGATLTFASDVRIDRTATGSFDAPDYTTVPPTPATSIPGYNDGTYVYRVGDVQIYGAGLNNSNTAAISNFTLTPDAANAFKVGYNCDGDGKIYAKVVDKATNSIEYYKDKECTMLIGKGDNEFFAATNNSGIPSSPIQNLDGIFMTLTDAAENLDVYEIAVVGQRMDNQKDFDATIGGWAQLGNSVMSGVNLGQNTSPEGGLFFKYTPIQMEDNGCVVRTFKVEVFSHASMDQKYLVATSGEVEANVQDAANGATVNGQRVNGQTVRIESVIMDNGKDSGLNITLNIPTADMVTRHVTALGSNESLPKGEQTGSVTFTNLGMRLYSDYGSNEMIQIQNKEGSLFYQYRDSDNLNATMIEKNTTVRVNGQDATVSLNGAPIITYGLIANTTTPDFSGSIVFNEGELGLTTIAVTGYQDGRLYSRATSLQGVQENESNIDRDRRHFEPPSMTLLMGDQATSAGMLNQGNKGVNIYLDFSQLDPTVEARIDDLGVSSNITVQYDTTNSPPELVINASDLNSTNAIPAIRVRVDPDKLKEGFYITDPALKGLYIKSDTLVDLNRSDTNSAVQTGTTTATNGDLLTEVGTYATNPRKTTSESMDNFVGGMQFQLGNSEGDQDRTVYSVPSMVMANMGQITYEGVDYCLQDVLGGGVASLYKDPIMAMRIIGQAVDDVTGLRARLGAFQSNMLQTNINSLNVAVENITKTEAAIRDTDMAAESTQFTRFQIMQQAGTSMLAQANQIQQNVLSLLQ